MQKICGLNISDFIDCQLIILESMLASKTYTTYNLDYYKNLFYEYGEENIKRFLGCVSLDLNELEIFFRADHDRIGNPEFECSLLSPLYKKPLLRINGAYVPVHTALIDAHIEFGIYDILKEKDPENFCSAFGGGFEKYIAAALGQARIEFLDEGDIRGITHHDRSCDFLIPGNDATLLIEVNPDAPNGTEIFEEICCKKPYFHLYYCQ